VKRVEIVPDMRVWGKLTCLEVKQKNKKKSWKLCMCMYLCVTSLTHNVYLYKSVKTHVTVVREVLSL
jgi:hypothetical protein